MGQAHVGTCFLCKQPRARRRVVDLPGAMARTLFPDWDAGVRFPARVCGPCLKERPDLRVATAGDAARLGSIVGA